METVEELKRKVDELEEENKIIRGQCVCYGTNDEFELTKKLWYLQGKYQKECEEHQKLKVKLNDSIYKNFNEHTFFGFTWYTEKGL